MINPELLNMAETLARAAYEKISCRNVEKNVSLTLRFAHGQNPVEIILDGKKVTAVAVDMATVFSLEGYYHQIEHNGTITEAESVQALSMVLTEEDVILCKSTYDAIGSDIFINCKYWTTTLDALTEEYIC